MKPFLQALADGPLLFDGAMGSLLYDRGIFLTRCYDELNCSRPELIERTHQDYVAAGAQILETNTFGANRLSLGKHGFRDLGKEINTVGVQLARTAAGEKAYVAGAMGPSGISFATAPQSERDQARDSLLEQMQWLVDAGVDLLVLETFQSILELEQAVADAKQTGLPVVAQLVFDAHGIAAGGLAPAEVAERLAAAGADVVGANCGVGPAELYDVAIKMLDHGAPVSIQPNAGFPSEIDGRTIYVANPEHFGVFARRMLKAGVSMVGGCCGTTPSHIRNMLGAVRMAGSAADSQELSVESIRRLSEHPEAFATSVPLGERSALGARLSQQKFVASVELTSPTGLNPSSLLNKCSELKDVGIAHVNIADGPRATARIGNIASCTLAANAGIEPILHVCCRDRNYLGLVSHLLGAHALGIRNLVIITGDPPKMGDFPFATPVYDVDSVGLLRIANGMNHGLDPAGKPMKEPTRFVLATGAEPAAADYERELRRLEEKKKAGAELVMTQPVYDPETLQRFLADTRELDLPIMVGVLPLASYRNAQFLHEQVPGMQIPKSYRERMKEAGDGPQGQAVGVAIAQEVLAVVRDQVQGVYVMPPFNRAHAAISVLETVKDKLA